MIDEPSDMPLSTDDKLEILHRVQAYFHICEQVKRSSVMSLVFGAIMLAIWFSLPQGIQYKWHGLVFVVLASLEFGTGFLNRFFPSLEGILLDGIVLVCFGAWNITREVLIWKNILPFGRGNVSPIFIMLGGYWVYQGFQTVGNYFRLNQSFGERPKRAHIRWFESLMKEARYPDPGLDPSTVSFPTDPPVNGKLLGDLAFFVINRDDVVIVSRDDVDLQIQELEDRSSPPLGHLRIMGQGFPPFKLSEENWNNYKAWKSAR